MTDVDIAHRVLFFLPQHLSIVIPSSQIVNNMHKAYGRIEPQKHAFSGFILGPSKTAEIEQSLVIGSRSPVADCVRGRGTVGDQAGVVCCFCTVQCRSEATRLH